MRCNDVESKLMAFVDGRLSRAEADRFEAHLEACPLCRKAYAEEVELVPAFREPVDGIAGEGLVNAVMQGIDAAAGAKPATIPNGIRIRAWAVASAAVLLAAVAAFGFFGPGIEINGGTPDAEVVNPLTAFLTETREAIAAVATSFEETIVEFYERGNEAWAEAQSEVSSATSGYATIIGALTVLAMAASALLVARYRKRIAEEVLR